MEKVIDRNAKKRKDRNTTERNKNGWMDFIERKEGQVWKDIWNGNWRQCWKCEQVCWQVPRGFFIGTFISEPPDQMLSYDFPGSFRNRKYAESNSGQERTKSGTLPVTDKDLASTYVLCCLSPTCP